jgi:hypothetical protein
VGGKKVKNILLRRGLVCGIAILFLGLCITSSIGVNVEQKSEQPRDGELAWWKFSFDAHSQELGMNKTDDIFVYVEFKSTGSGMLYSMSHTNPDRAYLDLLLDDTGHVTVEMGDVTCLFTVSSSGTFDDGNSHYVQMQFFGDVSEPTLD